MKRILLSTAYLPPVNYLSRIILSDCVVLEKQEYYVKQSYRNRCEILTANGKLSLSIPLIKQADKEIISDKKISYAENWQNQHWRAITSAYKNSPYFEYFEHEFKPFYDIKFEFLMDYNTQLLQTILNVLREKKQISFTEHYEQSPTHLNDFRKLSDIDNSDTLVMKPYYQVFGSKLGFTSNVSCLDALFNIGLKTIDIFQVSKA